ncbi:MULTISPECIES: hypothetical protein [Lysinibacillus]|uniref:hypothetical protein n=1 Tax=Lysinibacillus TaxID=400634 RepID=UPI00214AE635|nr:MULTISPECIES: hypothetical protein [Lysinibacillus]UUV26024.1 hypothetical protein NP781_05230 [Lysinibacillus sp. FN11]UYB48896.1 hypothetical protein OCI51_08015 [Lysinibacillus capsici]
MGKERNKKLFKQYELNELLEFQSSFREFVNEMMIDISSLTNMISEVDNSNLKLLRDNLSEISNALIKTQLELDKIEGLEKTYIENMCNLIGSGIDNLWFIDEEILLNLLDLYSINEKFVFDEKFVIKYINENFDTYIEPIINSAIFSGQKSILDEAVRLYKCQNYSLVLFPLFASFDNLFTRWIKGKVEEYNNFDKIFVKALGGKLRKIQDKYHPIQTLNLDDSTRFTIAMAYPILFNPDPTEKERRLNRNSIMHGSHDYESVTKEDCMKLFVLLRLALDAIKYEPIKLYH